MGAPYPAVAIANYFIKKAHEDRTNITLMKVSKLVYIAHGFNLAIYDKPLVDEPVQAWKFGPVIASIYSTYKNFGEFPITRITLEEIDESDNDTKELLNKIWESNKAYTAFQLSSWSHEKGSPWDKVWSKSPGTKNMIISDDIIKPYFYEISQDNEKIH